MAASGTAVFVLCLTRGEASTLHGVPGDLAKVRADEMLAAAETLGLAGVKLLDHPDGALIDEPFAKLLAEARTYAAGIHPAGLVAFDPSGVTGHPDHQVATRVAEALGRHLGLEVLGWTLPAEVAERLNTELGAGFIGHTPEKIDIVLPVDRRRQMQAVACHASQAVPGSALWRRLELLGDTEHLRWLRRR